MSLHYKTTEFTDAETAYTAILNNVQGSFKSFFTHFKRDILRILMSWINSRPGESAEARSARSQSGQSRHMLVFQDYTNMARAVMGEFLSECQLEEHEDPLAEQVVNSQRVNQLLADLLRKYQAKKNELFSPAANFTQFCTSAKAVYKPLYKDKSTTIEAVMQAPENYCFSDKIVTLHDLTKYLKVSVPSEKTMGTYYKVDDSGHKTYGRRLLKGSADFRYSDKNPDKSYVHYTLKENSGFILAARVHGTPIWAGPSFTTARLLFAAQNKAGASQLEIDALAWGIFAFWNQCYPSSSTWVHRFHATLDMAVNFGVYYEPFQYPKSIPF